MLVFDASALVKILVDEEGSEAARGLWLTSGPRAASALAYVEVCSALGRATAGRRISAPAMHQALLKLDDLWGSMGIVDATAELSVAAGSMAITDGLNGADAVHLATALSVGPESTLLVTWDKALSRAAREHGLAVAP